MRMEKQQLEQEKNITIEEYMSAVYGIVSDMDRPLSACVHSYACTGTCAAAKTEPEC